jgi:hypothetical protein
LQESWEKNNDMNMTCKLFNNISTLKYIAITVTGGNFFLDEINSRINVQNSYYPENQKFGNSLLPYKEVYIKLCKSGGSSVVSYGFESGLVTLCAEYR